jgi:ketosteroid isomerase-like protein
MNTIDVIERFGAAWGAHDLDATLALVTDDIVFESTGPAPDGIRFEGRDAVRGAWEPIFADPDAIFTVESTHCVSGDRVAQCWIYDWGDGHVRGVDLFIVRDDLVSEKFSYVKG